MGGPGKLIEIRTEGNKKTTIITSHTEERNVSGLVFIKEEVGKPFRTTCLFPKLK